MCMPFNPIKAESSTFFIPSDPDSGGNATGDMFYGCNNNEDRDRIQDYWADLNKQYGLNVLYFVNGYDLDEHDALYGEHPTSKFGKPTEIRLLVNIENQNTILSQWGIVTDTDIQFYIPIPEFSNVFGEVAVPNRGDLIQIPDEACDRPEDQEPKVFQITSKKDSVEPIDLFASHSVWFLEGKRFDFSYEEDAPDEGGEPITNSDFVGLLDGNTQEKSEDKTYGPSADDEAQEDLKNDTNSGVYGNYL